MTSKMTNLFKRKSRDLPTIPEPGATPVERRNNTAPHNNARNSNQYDAVHLNFGIPRQQQRSSTNFANFQVAMPQQSSQQGSVPSGPPTRKMPVLAHKKSLPSHSHLSLVKRAIQGAEDGTLYNRAIYQEKRILDTMEKYILAKSEGADIWSSYMRDESNLAVRDLYQRLCQLETLWVQQHNNHRSEVAEQRKLFQLLMLGEQNLLQQQKRANTASTRVKKLQKQMDDTLAKNRNNKDRAIDLRKLEQIQRDLERAVSLNEQVQSQFQSQTSNNQIFKYNKIKKMLVQLAESEVNLYQDSWRIAEVKLQLTRIHLGKAYSKLTLDSVQKANAESASVIRQLYNDLGLPAPADCDQSAQAALLPRRPTRRPVTQTVSAPGGGGQDRGLDGGQDQDRGVLREGPEEYQLATRVSSQVPVLTMFPPHGDHQRSLPSAPSADLISLRSSVRSDGSSESEMDACYSPIPDLDLDSEVSIDNKVEEYIYEFDEEEFEQDIYQNVEDGVVSTPEYLDLDNDQSTAPNSDRGPGPPILPPRRPPITEEDIYEDTDVQPEPSFPPPSMSSHQGNSHQGDSHQGSGQDEDIFGTISDITRPPGGGLYPTLGGGPGSRGSYGEMWNASTGNSARTPAQTSSSNPSRQDSGFSSMDGTQGSSGGAQHRSSGAQQSSGGAQGSSSGAQRNSGGAQRNSGGAQWNSGGAQGSPEEAEPRYVSGTGRGRPAARPQYSSPNRPQLPTPPADRSPGPPQPGNRATGASNRPQTAAPQAQEIESELQTLFKQKFRQFKQDRASRHASQDQPAPPEAEGSQEYDVPPPLPRKVGRSLSNNAP